MNTKIAYYTELFELPEHECKHTIFEKNKMTYNGIAIVLNVHELESTESIKLAFSKMLHALAINKEDVLMVSEKKVGLFLQNNVFKDTKFILVLSDYHTTLFPHISMPVGTWFNFLEKQWFCFPSFKAVLGNKALKTHLWTEVKSKFYHA